MSRRRCLHALCDQAFSTELKRVLADISAEARRSLPACLPDYGQVQMSTDLAKMQLASLGRVPAAAFILMCAGLPAAVEAMEPTTGTCFLATRQPGLDSQGSL